MSEEPKCPNCREEFNVYITQKPIHPYLKVYCKDCKHYQPDKTFKRMVAIKGAADVWEEVGSCKAPQNIEPSWYSDSANTRRLPCDINKDNACGWFREK